MGQIQSNTTTNKRWTSKEIENNIVRVFSKDTYDNATSVETLGWNDRQNGSGRSYKDYGNDIRNVRSQINNKGAVKDIIDQQTDDHEYVNDIINGIIGNDLRENNQLGGTLSNKDRHFFDLKNLPDSPLTEMGNKVDIDILRKIQKQISGDNVQNNLSATSITPVSDVNIGSFNGTNGSLSMRQPLSVNRLY